MKIRRNDEVFVITGSERGKRGKVRRVLPQEDRLIVEGLNVAKRHTKPRGAGRQGGIIEKELPMHISNVMLVCNKCGKPTRVAMRFVETGKKVRACKHCGEVID